MAHSIDSIIARARAECDRVGVKLTPKRQNILLVLLLSEAPLSAYDIVDSYRERYHESLPAMSVYRILNFLVDNKLVHKLETTNQFLPCAHIACDHQHEIPQFLICDRCHAVAEVGLRKTLVRELQDSVRKAGFALTSQQLELHGVCAKCRGESAMESNSSEDDDEDAPHRH
ncbi:MAG TPA: Fur family transcriptional regulator [Cellvibrio sp.]|nr:Fur family transcriptional regulator [Cellvibrio sp.]